MLPQNLFFTRCLNIFNHSRIFYNNRISSTNCYQQINGIKTVTAEKFKELKLPEKPKKPGTAYFLYLQERRKELLKENPHLKNTELVRKCAEEWRHIQPTVKDKYESVYKKQMDEFTQKYLKYTSQLTDEQKQILNELKLEKKKAKQKRELRKMYRETNKPKRPISAYTYYLMDQWKKLNKPYNEIIGELKGKWSNLTEHEREPYHQQADKDRERYDHEMELWEKRMVREGKETLLSSKTKKTIPKIDHKQ